MVRGRGPGMDMGRWPPPERGMGWGAGGRRGPPYAGEPGGPWGGRGMGPDPMGYPDGPGGELYVLFCKSLCCVSHDSVSKLLVELPLHPAVARAPWSSQNHSQCLAAQAETDLVCLCLLEHCAHAHVAWLAFCFSRPSVPVCPGWGPAGPDWGAGGRRFPPFDDRFSSPYDGRGGFDRPRSPPIPRRGAPASGLPAWDRPDSPAFRGDYDRPTPGGRAWGGAAQAAWDAPPVERRRGPSADRGGGWGVSVSRGPAASAIPLEELSPPRAEPSQPSQPRPAPASASTLEALPAPPSRVQHGAGPVAHLPDPPRSHSHTNGMHTDGVRGEKPQLKQAPSSEPSKISRADARGAAVLPQGDDSRRADGREQPQPQSSAPQQEKEPAAARVWFYVDPQVSVPCSKAVQTPLLSTPE